MSLHSPYRARERILLIGAPGSGKSTAHLNIARFHQSTRSLAVFRIMDTDAAINRMLDSGYSSLTNVEVYPTYDWSDYLNNTKKILSISKPDDFIVVDMISSAWEAVQEYFTNEIFQKGIGDYFLEARKSVTSKDKNLQAFDGWRDWVVINGLYRDWINPLIFRSRSHVIGVAKADSINQDKERDKQTRMTFGPYGVKPVGQKHLGFQFHTLLILMESTPNDYTITTVKDRERPKLIGESYNSFANTYLIKIAGWTLK